MMALTKHRCLKETSTATESVLFDILASRAAARGSEKYIVALSSFFSGDKPVNLVALAKL